MIIKPIAHIENDFTDKFCIPRQSGLSKIKSKIVFEKEYSDENSVRCLDEFSHIWLIWGFSENEGKGYSPTVRPPRLGGNKRVGVFATRSPFRPNSLGISCVKLEKISKENGKTVITVLGADIMNQTPIYDIKPYIKYTDCIDGAVSGFTEATEFPLLSVNIPKELLNKIPYEKQSTLFEILKQDPRPAYQNDKNRSYGFKFSEYEIKFNVKGNALTVTSIENE